MKKPMATKWWWAMWLVTVVLLVGATASAEQLGPVVYPMGDGPPAAEAKTFPRRESVKKKTALLPGEAKIDLNTAPVEVLVTLPGIGKKRAEKIVELRTKRAFRRVTELRRVRGVGKKTMKRLLPLITVSKPAPRAKATAKKKRPRGRVRMVVPG